MRSSIFPVAVLTFEILHTGVAEASVILGCDALSLWEQFLIFVLGS